MRSITVAVGFLSSIIPVLAAAPPALAVIAGVEVQIAAKEYEPSRHGETWMASNREQGFRVTFDGRGMRLAPRTSAAVSWEWRLALVGVGRPSAVAEVAAATVRVDGARVIYDRGNVVEWFVNASNGLEQGFTLAAPLGARGGLVIDLDVSGKLEPRFDRDGRSVDFFRPGARVAELRYTDLDVKDALGHPLPAHMEPLARTGNAGIRLVFDDTGAVYPVTVDPLLTKPLTTLQSGQTTSWFGYSVSTAGDVNGDGYSDIIVGAPLYDNGQDAEGRAYVYLGGPNGIATSPAWTTESDQAQALYGWPVAAAGDVNGDGYDDVIVGAQGWSTGVGTQGKVWVYLGSATGLSTTAVWTKVGQDGSNFGIAAGTAGDVNGDGFADVIVGAPFESNGQSNEGRAYVFLGSASGLGTNAAWIAESNQANADFGVAVATAGDVNGDGYDDVIIGADQYDNPEFNEGRAYVYLGGPSGLAAAPQFTPEGNQAGAGFGASVGTAGDINGDGYADIIIGAPGYDDPENAEGRVVVYYGGTGGVGGPPQWFLELNIAGAHLGNSVGTAGDVNGDGFADVIVGASQVTSADGVDGKALVYLGSLSGLAPSPAFTLDGFANAYVGTSVGTAGDVDGDGMSDVIIGAQAPLIDGRVYVYRFDGDVPLTTPAWAAEGNQTNSDYGVAVASAGDVNGDGFSDVIVGAHRWDSGQVDVGKAELYLGSPSGLAVTPSWTVVGNVPGGLLGISLDSAGDVNGDGYADVIVGSPVDSNAGVRVYYGGPGGLPLTPNWTARSATPAAFGVCVAGAGDVNGDGYADVIVGDDSYSGSVSLEGAAFVYLGSSSGLSPTPAWTVTGTSTNDAFGDSVASAGDVNGDGYGDVIVGSRTYTNGQFQQGRALLYLGSAAGLSVVPVWTQEGNAFNGQFGGGVASAGDVNGDGYADVVIGGNGPGAIWLGGPGGLTLDALGPIALGAGGASAGDINNDGYGDVVTGPPNFSLLLGSASGQMTSWWTVSPGAPVLHLGHPMASAGDVNGDGFSDIVVGVNNFTHDQNQEGAAFLYLGGAMTNGPYSRQRGPRQLQSNGTTPIGLYGKSDATTGFHIVANGMTAAGRTHIRYVWEVKPLGTPFNGSGLGTSPVTDTGTPVPLTGSTVHFTPVVSGLGGATAYHWRTRSESANPYFPQTPWLSAVGNTTTETKLRTSGCRDLDGDGRGAPSDGSCAFSAVDCNDANPSIWSKPGPTQNLRFTGKTTLAWDVPADPGAVLASTVYDTLRSTSASDFSGAFCVESDDGADLVAVDNGTPAAGQVFFYLTRAQNGCPIGVGSLGTNTAGFERTGRNCP